MTDSIQTIRQSAKHFFSGTMLSRITGMLRDMSMAYVFGTQPAVAAFMLAFRFAHLLRRLFGEGALQSAFIPQFEALRCQDSKKAFLFFRDLYVALTIVLLFIIIISSVILIFFLSSDSLSENNREIIFLTLLMLPSLLFICLYGFNSSLLQCEKQFFTSSVAPVAFNAIWILAVLALNYFNFNGAEAMPLLACSIIIACFCQWLLTTPPVLSLLKNGCAGSMWKEIQLCSPDVFKIGKPLLLGMIGVAAFQVNNAVDALFARYADPEGPALLWYAIRLQQLPLSLFGIAIAGAILPPLSRAIKSSDWNSYYRFLNEGLKQTISLILPLTCLFLVAGDTCTNFIYGRGNFDADSIIGTTRCLWAYTLGLFPSSLILILAPAYYAQSDYRLPTYASFLTMFINGILNTILIVGFNLGAVSVALATSMSAWINLFLLIHFLFKTNQSLFSSLLIKHLIKTSFISLIACMGTLSLRIWTQNFSPFNLFNSMDLSFQKEIIDQALSVIYQLGIFGLFWGIGFFLIHSLSLKKQLS